MDRYHRQALLPGIGRDGQARIRASRVAVVGLGALGSVAADLLARAGVGSLVLADRDVVETTNLQRQTLYTDDDVAAALPKAQAAAARLARVNPDVDLRPVVADVTAANVLDVLDGAAAVVDGCDSFETRLLLNDACLRLGIAFVHGAAVGTYGLQATFVPGRTACYACLVGEPPAPGVMPTCDTAGVLASATASVAAIQVAETLKCLVGRPQDLRATLLSFDLWTNERREVAVPRDPACPACGQGRLEWLDGRRGTPAVRLCGRESLQVPAAPGTRVDLAALAARLQGIAESVSANAFLLRFEVEGCEVVLFADGRALVHGTTDPARARAVLARYVGL